jgi:hypothetical protein
MYQHDNRLPYDGSKDKGQNVVCINERLVFDEVQCNIDVPTTN